MSLYRQVQIRNRAACACKKTIPVAATLLVMACVSPKLWAGTILDLSFGRGVFEYASGERHPRFYGIGINVRDLTLGAKQLPILKGRLVFSDANFLGSHGGSYFWGPGGTLTVRGSLDGVSGTLLTGKFLGAKLVEVNGKEMLEAEVRDHLNPQLVALLHLSTGSYTGQLDLVLANARHGRWWTLDRVQSGSLIDGNVSESSSIWLLGASLLAWIGVRRFRRVLYS